MHDLLGEDDYGEEEYGAETSYPAAKKKVQEAEFDFMWGKDDDVKQSVSDL